MKMSPTLPKQELNGLNAVHGDAVGHPGKTYLVVGLIAVDEVRTHRDKTKEAVVKFERLEVAGSDAQAYLAEILEGTFEERTGKTPLDLDMPGVEDLRKRFRGPRGGAAAKGEPSLAAEPAQLEAAVRLDPAVLTPEEQAEADGVIDAEVEDEPETDTENEWARANMDADDPGSQGYTGGTEGEPDEDPSERPNTPTFSG